MRKLILRWIINAVAVYAAMRLVPGITAEGGWTVYLWMGLILGLVNALIAPIIKLLTCPLIILSLGIFTLVINAAMLLLASSLAQSLGQGFHVDGFGPAFWGAIVVSLVSFALSILIGINRSDEHYGA
ncbi:MAG: phage holin family protein [Anaerolineae bacterium]|nr:phage holin family protein [Anaerolineae bacterium]